MLTIALTGGIGSGKTSVCKLFQELGHSPANNFIIKIIDADLIAISLLTGSLTGLNSSLLIKVKQLFGDDVFKSKHLDRIKLRQKIFSSNMQKQQLESLLHPLVYQEIHSQIQKLKVDEKRLNKHKKKTYIVIIAIPLLLETKKEKEFDRVLVIDSSIDLQIERTRKRDNCSEKLIKQIIHSQLDRLKRLDSADDIIENNTSFDELYSQVEKLLKYYSTAHCELYKEL